MPLDDGEQVMARLEVAMRASEALRQYVSDTDKIHQPRKDHMSKPETIPAAEPDPAVARLRKLPCTVTESGLATITRAVALRLAQSGFTAATTPEVYGTALAAIVGDWLTTEAERLQVARKEA